MALDPLSKLVSRLREQARKWAEVRLELDRELIALDAILFLDQDLPRILWALQYARHTAAELVVTLETMATQLEETRKTTEWRG